MTMSRESLDTAGTPRGRRPLVSLSGGTLVLMAALAYAVVVGYGARHGLLYVLGIGCGFTLYQARFGFSAVFLHPAEAGHGQAVYAHTLMLAVASLLFAPLLAHAPAVFGLHPHGFVYPIGAGVVGGAFLFGVGVQLGGACTAGTLYDIGGGYVAMLLTLAGFAGGAVLGAWHWRFWTHDLPSAPPVSLAQGPWGYGGALLMQLAALALVVLVRAVVARRHPAPPSAPRAPRAARRPWSIGRVRRPWPLWAGAVLLAALNALTLLVKGAPWGITVAFTLAGSQLAAALGAPVASWAYWSGARAGALRAPLLADATAVMDAGLVLGALLAATLAGTFTLRRPIAWPTAFAAVGGGVLMGYGAVLADGCTIGGYFGGIASFSLHGWAWAAAAFVGSYAGGHLVARMGLPVLRARIPVW